MCKILDLGVLITCEHGGNIVPKEYKWLFEGKDATLNTHRAYDLGALDLAKEIAHRLDAPLFFGTETRLLIELNRALSSRTLFSEFSRNLTKDEKDKIISAYYLPYRKNIETAIQSGIKKQKKILHLSIHSFTPNLNGVERNCDIGLLFDPKRKEEKLFCTRLCKKLTTDSDLHVRYNYPYRGTADGFTTSLRKLYPADCYAGIEIEVNQKFVDQKGKLLHSVTRELLKGLQYVIEKTTWS